MKVTNLRVTSVSQREWNSLTDEMRTAANVNRFSRLVGFFLFFLSFYSFPYKTSFHITFHMDSFAFKRRFKQTGK